MERQGKAGTIRDLKKNNSRGEIPGEMEEKDMKIYYVDNNETGYHEDFYNLRDAKKAMREHNATGEIVKVWSNGDWEPCGPIKLTGTNKTMMANTRQKVPSYN